MIRWVPRDESERRIREYEAARRGGRTFRELEPDEAKRVLKAAERHTGERFRIEGVAFPPLEFRPRIWRRINVVDSDLTHLRLARPRLGRGGRLEDCSFDAVLFDSLRWRDLEIDRCRFHRSRFANGRIDRCSIAHTTFEGCSFESADSYATTYIGTVFDRARMTRSGFDRCEFVDVTISGTLDGSGFKSVRAKGLDLRAAQIVDSSFVDPIHGDVRFPQHPESFVVRREAFDLVRAALAASLSPHAGQVYDSITTHRGFAFQAIDRSSFDFGDDDVLGGVSPEEQATIVAALYAHRVASTLDQAPSGEA